MENIVYCNNCNHKNALKMYDIQNYCENCNDRIENKSRMNKENKSNVDLFFTKQSTWQKVLMLSVIGVILYKIRYILLVAFLDFFMQVSVYLSIFSVQEFIHTLNYNFDLLNRLSGLGFILFMVGFIDKFFLEFFPNLFNHVNQLRSMIPTFPFSTLIKFLLSIIELLSRITWIFSSTVVRFFIALGSLIFVVLYRLFIPVFKYIILFLDKSNVILDKSSKKMTEMSKKLEENK